MTQKILLPETYNSMPLPECLALFGASISEQTPAPHSPPQSFKKETMVFTGEHHAGELSR